MYTCLVYKDQLVMITKEYNPIWFCLYPDKCNPPYYTWEDRLMNLEATVVCAVTYLDYVYILGKYFFFF